MIRHIVGLVVPVLVLAACGAPEHSDLKQWMQDQASTMKGKVPPLPQIEPFPAVSYEGVALIPPFSTAKIISTEAVADKTAPDHNRLPQPLERFPLEDLRVIGIIVEGNTPHALIQTPPPNKPKHVRIGEYLGQNFGRVISITRDTVMVRETTKDANGAWVPKETPLRVMQEGVR
jgi:type IV pilus assembly protein PilP